MNKIAEFLSKWAFAIVLCLIAVALLGIAGTIGVSIALACVSGWIIIEIKEG